MSKTVDFLQVARLPDKGDNVAIATTELEAGIQINYCGQIITLDHTVMEGHQFAVESISKDQYLLSWGLPFGRAVKEIESGNYICNEGMLSALNGRSINFKLPDGANFVDHIEPYILDKTRFSPSSPSTPPAAPPSAWEAASPARACPPQRGLQGPAGA